MKPVKLSVSVLCGTRILYFFSRKPKKRKISMNLLHKDCFVAVEIFFSRSNINRKMYFKWKRIFFGSYWPRFGAELLWVDSWEWQGRNLKFIPKYGNVNKVKVNVTSAFSYFPLESSWSLHNFRMRVKKEVQP